MFAQNDMSLLIKFTVLGVCVCFNLFSISTLFFGNQSISEWQNARDLRDGLLMQIADIDEQNMEISEEIRLLQSDTAYMEKIIRQSLKYVKGSEVLYVFEFERDYEYTSPNILPVSEVSADE